MNALGKTSMPTKKEVEYINRWTKDFGYEMDVIDAACERTVLSTDKHRFEYADRILSGWYQANVHHKSDIAKAAGPYPSRKQRLPINLTSSNKTAMISMLSKRNY